MFDMLPFDRKQNDLFHTLDRIEKNFFGDFDKEFSAIRTDIIEQENGFLLQAELPGFQKEDIDISLNGTMLTITAKQDQTQEDKTDRFIRRERRFGSFTRSFDVSNIDVHGITAQYQDGILEVTLPKAAPSLPSPQQIAIE